MAHGVFIGRKSQNWAYDSMGRLEPGGNNENDLMQVMKHEPYIAQYNII